MYENDSSAIAVGKRLRHLRELANLKRETLSKMAKVGKSSISLWEHATSDVCQMTIRSREKILAALKDAGVECTDRWLREGTGLPPKINFTSFNSNITAVNPQNNTLRNETQNHNALINNMRKEIKVFQLLGDSAIVFKVEHNYMLPAYETGDTIGGIWQPVSSLKAEKMCIIFFAGKLDVRRVKPGSKEGLFHVSYLAYDSSQLEPFEIKDISLDKIAPIIRVWRC